MALAQVIAKIFGSKADRDYKAVKPLLNKILSSYEEIDKLSADELRAHSAKLRAYLREVEKPFEDRIADVWLTGMEQYREYQNFSKCSRCRLLAWCRGCPAVARGTNGDFYADDPQCWASEENGLLSPACDRRIG